MRYASRRKLPSLTSDAQGVLWFSAWLLLFLIAFG